MIASYSGGRTIRATSKLDRRKRRRDPSEKTMGSRIKRRSIKRAETDITCKKEVEFIAEYLSKDLDLQQSNTFENHLKICDDCVAFLETYKKIIELTRAFLIRSAQSNRSDVIKLN